MGAAKNTTDHTEIKRWVMAHGGCPATVKRTQLGARRGAERLGAQRYAIVSAHSPAAARVAAAAALTGVSTPCSTAR